MKLSSTQKDELNLLLQYFKPRTLGKIRIHQIIMALLSEDESEQKIVDELFKFENMPDAAFEHALIGFCYEGGVGISQSLEKAIQAFRNALNQGYRPAHYKLALLYKAQKDLTKAREHFKLATMCPEPLEICNNAKYDYGMCLLYEGNIESNKLEAIKYLTDALLNGSTYAWGQVENIITDPKFSEIEENSFLLQKTILSAVFSAIVDKEIHEPRLNFNDKLVIRLKEILLRQKERNHPTLKEVLQFIKNKFGYNAVYFWVIDKGYIDLLEELLQQNLAELNERDSDGQTALLRAVVSNCNDMVEHLLTHRQVDISEVHNNKSGVLHLAVESLCNASLSLQGRESIIEKLFEHGAYFEQQNDENVTPLEILVELHDEDNVSTLQGVCAVFQALTEAFIYPLSLADRYNNIEFDQTINFFSQNPKYLNARNNKGDTLLHILWAYTLDNDNREDTVINNSTIALSILNEFLGKNFGLYDGKALNFDEINLEDPELRLNNSPFVDMLNHQRQSLWTLAQKKTKSDEGMGYQKTGIENTDNNKNDKSLLKLLISLIKLYRLSMSKLKQKMPLKPTEERSGKDAKEATEQQLQKTTTTEQDQKDFSEVLSFTLNIFKENKDFSKSYKGCYLKAFLGLLLCNTKNPYYQPLMAYKLFSSIPHPTKLGFNYQNKNWGNWVALYEQTQGQCFALLEGRMVTPKSLSLEDGQLDQNDTQEKIEFFLCDHSTRGNADETSKTGQKDNASNKENTSVTKEDANTDALCLQYKVFHYKESGQVYGNHFKILSQNLFNIGDGFGIPKSLGSKSFLDEDEDVGTMTTPKADYLFNLLLEQAKEIENLKATLKQNHNTGSGVAPMDTSSDVDKEGSVGDKKTSAEQRKSTMPVAKPFTPSLDTSRKRGRSPENVQRSEDGDVNMAVPTRDRDKAKTSGSSSQSSSNADSCESADNRSTKKMRIQGP